MTTNSAVRAGYILGYSKTIGVRGKKPLSAKSIRQLGWNMEHRVWPFGLPIILALTHCIHSKSPVYFSLFASGGENGFRSSGAIPAVDIALEEIERNQLLPGYNLTYENWRDSKVFTTYCIASDVS